ncbi:P-loop ATPase, Sll1717 family [Sphingosinicella sp. BN140058]|uniref:P-loop ATPase, Sll1717 family n=1 Tax=Sphingosinicella sp. BN140058 TaxID=1892855 RepID=UPI001010E5F3|nr:hypothetical protein [Sphingosinicella sp. BN140058]QAY77788.1 hypothetical protein ETR14_15650 [Sphingosinicella sp. BN140058]
MAISKESFLGSRGFSENPFILTNADEEQNLSSYFVPPPFFDAVLGRPTEPKSCTVFAPRGGGKTAQKVMIEKASGEARLEDQFLCLTYDRFVLPDRFLLKNATVDWHLLNLVRLITTALLVRLDAPEAKLRLDQADRDFLVKAARTFLYDINVAEFQAIVAALRNWRGRTEDLVKKYGGQIVNLISAIVTKFEMGKIELIAGEREINKPTVMAYFERLIGVAAKLGFESVYVLVDRVDETLATQNDANSSFEFIESLLLDLHILETRGVAFKFFLWDQIKSRYLSSGARTDRIPMYSLNWNLEEMSTMLRERLKAYSGGSIASLNELLPEDLEYDLHSLVCVLAVGSPRDMIRLCKAIIDEQTRTSNVAGSLSRNVISRGIRAFSEQRTLELFGNSLEDLRKVNLASFTISKLANDIFRVTSNAISRKIQIWTDQGAVVRTGEVPTPGARPQNLYSLADPRLCITVKSQSPVESVLESNIYVCGSCGSVNVFEEDDASSCSRCQASIDSTLSSFRMVAPGL